MISKQLVVRTHSHMLQVYLLYELNNLSCFIVTAHELPCIDHGFLFSVFYDALTF